MRGCGLCHGFPALNTTSPLIPKMELKKPLASLRQSLDDGRRQRQRPAMLQASVAIAPPRAPMTKTRTAVCSSILEASLDPAVEPAGAI